MTRVWKTTVTFPHHAPGNFDSVGSSLGPRNTKTYTFDFKKILTNFPGGSDKSNSGTTYSGHVFNISVFQRKELWVSEFMKNIQNFG